MPLSSTPLTLTVRSAEWRPLVVVATLSPLLGWLVQPSDAYDTRTFAVVLRMSSLLLGTGCAYLLYEPLGESAAACSVPQSRRFWTLFLSGAALAATSWLITIALAGRTFPAGADLGRIGLGVEAVTLGLTVVATTTVLYRYGGDAYSSITAAGITVGIVLCTLPIRDDVWPNPGEPHWNATHWWWLASAAALLVLVATAAHRDR